MVQKIRNILYAVAFALLFNATAVIKSQQQLEDEAVTRTIAAMQETSDDTEGVDTTSSSPFFTLKNIPTQLSLEKFDNQQLRKELVKAVSLFRSIMYELARLSGKASLAGTVVSWKVTKFFVDNWSIANLAKAYTFLPEH